ncbi:unnamed protein product [Amoebophrya sp. A25]|nr:unnamed protein product [Amoebophrya sp. A25]|eukprot:GSA25T00005282001.1
MALPSSFSQQRPTVGRLQEACRDMERQIDSLIQSNQQHASKVSAFRARAVRAEKELIALQTLNAELLSRAMEDPAPRSRSSSRPVSRSRIQSRGGKGPLTATSSLRVHLRELQEKAREKGILSASIQAAIDGATVSASSTSPPPTRGKPKGGASEINSKQVQRGGSHAGAMSLSASGVSLGEDITGALQRQQAFTGGKSQFRELEDEHWDMHSRDRMGAEDAIGLCVREKEQSDKRLADTEQRLVATQDQLAKSDANLADALRKIADLRGELEFVKEANERLLAAGALSNGAAGAGSMPAESAAAHGDAGEAKAASSRERSKEMVEGGENDVGDAGSSTRLEFVQAAGAAGEDDEAGGGANSQEASAASGAPHNSEAVPETQVANEESAVVAAPPEPVSRAVAEGGAEATTAERATAEAEDPKAAPDGVPVPEDPSPPAGEQMETDGQNPPAGAEITEGNHEQSAASSSASQPQADMEDPGQGVEIEKELSSSTPQEENREISTVTDNPPASGTAVEDNGTDGGAYAGIDTVATEQSATADVDDSPNAAVIGEEILPGSGVEGTEKTTESAYLAAEAALFKNRDHYIN